VINSVFNSLLSDSSTLEVEKKGLIEGFAQLLGDGKRHHLSEG